MKPEVKKSKICYRRIITKNDNCLQVFYNPDNDLLVVDLIAKNEKGGNEIIRTTLNETKLLEHIDNKEVV
jgi:hypothetical protein